MRTSMIIAALLLGVAPALADDTVYVHPRIPGEEEKKAALMRAYELNGNSMSRYGSIDLSKPDYTPGIDDSIWPTVPVPSGKDPNVWPDLDTLLPKKRRR